MDPTLKRVRKLRYGEDPHQEAALYMDATVEPWGVAGAMILGGKELSYNNLLDSDAAVEAIRGLSDPAVVLVKHLNPCGMATGHDLSDAFDRALGSDPISAFGGVMAVNQTVTPELVARMAHHKIFLEIVIAPDFEPTALVRLKKRKDLRILKHSSVLPPPGPGQWRWRSVSGGLLVQELDAPDELPDFVSVTTREPDPDELRGLKFAWTLVRAVRSNAIVLVKGTQSVGIGAGQMSRVDAVRVALEKAGERACGSVLASDAFFPFPDGVEKAAAGGVRAIVQPGGSKGDPAVIEAANRHGMAMVFTSIRHFRH